jgi:hypothetical protein
MASYSVSVSVNSAGRAAARARTDDDTLANIKVTWDADPKHGISPTTDYATTNSATFNADLSGDLTDAGTVSVKAVFYDADRKELGSDSASASFQP